MSTVNEFLIKWADGTEVTHRSNEHYTVDDVANSVFGMSTAADVLKFFGHTIEPIAAAAPAEVATAEAAPQED